MMSSENYQLNADNSQEVTVDCLRILASSFRLKDQEKLIVFTAHDNNDFSSQLHMTFIYRLIFRGLTTFNVSAAKPEKSWLFFIGSSQVIMGILATPLVRPHLEYGIEIEVWSSTYQLQELLYLSKLYNLFKTADPSSPCMTTL